MKKVISVVVIAVLSMAVFVILPLPNAKAGTSEAKVMTYSWYTAPSNSVLARYPGDLVVVGEVQNVGTGILHQVNVTGIAYNSAGQTLAAARGQAFTYETIPEQKAPFVIDFTPASGSTNDQNWISSVASVTVSVISVADTIDTPYAGLEVPHQIIYGSNENGTYIVEGVIQNNGTETTGPVWAVTTFYNASGTVVGLNFTQYLTDSLAPGDTLMLFASPADNTPQLSNSIYSFSYVIDSLTAATSSTQTAPTPTASPAFPKLSIILLAVLVVVVCVAVIAVLMTLRRRQKKLPPPPPPTP